MELGLEPSEAALLLREQPEGGGVVARGGVRGARVCPCVCARVCPCVLVCAHVCELVTLSVPWALEIKGLSPELDRPMCGHTSGVLSKSALPAAQWSETLVGECPRWAKRCAVGLPGTGGPARELGEDPQGSLSPVPRLLSPPGALRGSSGCLTSQARNGGAEGQATARRPMATALHQGVGPGLRRGLGQDAEWVSEARLGSGGVALRNGTLGVR